MENITIESPEFKALYIEVMNRAEAIRKREEYSEESFRYWLCEAVRELAEKMGFFIQDLKEFTLDLGDSFMTGFNAGRERAKMNSYRAKKMRK